MSETYYTARPISPHRYFNEYVTNGGDNNMAVDGSITPVLFTTGPAQGDVLELARLIFYLESTSDFDSITFMDLAALAKGVQINVGGVEIALWKDNADITCCMYDTAGMSQYAKLGRAIAGRWTFTKGTGGESLLVKGNETVEFVIQDDLSDALIFRARAQGETRME